MLISLLPTAAFAAVAGEDAIPMAAPAAEEDGKATTATPAVVEDDLPVVLAEDITDSTNLARLSGVTVTASSRESTSSLGPEMVIDGDTTSKPSRWSSDATSANKDQQQWIKLDLGQTRTVGSVKVFWERNNILAYDVQVSADDATWDTVFDHPASAGRITVLNCSIDFTPREVRYVKVEINGRDDFGEGASGYFNATMYEIEVYPTQQNEDPLAGMTKIPMADTTVDVSGVEHTNFPADKAIDCDETTRWSSQNDSNTAYITLDLHRLCAVTGVRLLWQRDNVTAYTLDLSTDGQTWNTVHTCENRIADLTEVFTFKEVPDVRYVRVNVTGHDDNGAAGYRNISLFEIEVYGTAGELITSNPPPSAEVIASTPSRNLCRPTDGVTVTATASSTEAASVAAANAIDGNTTSNSSRWGSAVGNGPHSITIDLGALRAVSVVKIFWERRNVLAYTLEGSADNQNWMTLYTCNSEITNTTETLTFDPVAIRYLKLNITSHKSTGIKWDGTESVSWNTVSLFEIEAYRDENAISLDASAVLETITSHEAAFAISQDGKLVLNPDITVPEDFTVTFAANLEQVVGADGTIYTPVVDKEVAIDLTVTDNTDPTNTAATPGNSPIRIIVPGAHTAAENEGGNPKPAVIPEIMEWYSHGDNAGYKDQSYTLTDGQVRILYRYAFAGVAKELQTDLKDLFGVEATLQRLNDTAYTTLQNVVQNGDIVLYDVNPNSSSEDTRNRVQGYDDETYGMEIYGGKVYIYATHSTGAYWGTRTLLQGLKLSGDERSFPNGTLRDYPEFKLRGFILDVGRKPLSMQKLQEIAKNMAWYKMNDLHIHLNDNLIFLEDYISGSWTNPTEFAKANNAYSAFRLESSIQEEADAVAPLAAKDYHYTKAEYKSFVESSAAIGVNVVSEIDVPAHAKAVTDAFPSLRLFNSAGMTNHPYNDHLNLTTKYDQSLALVKSIFDEYIDSGVFGSSAHFGADEYYDSHPSYRRFVKDMVDYFNSKPNLTTKRVWGSLSSMSNNPTQYPTSDIAAEGIQMNIWSTDWANPQAMYDLGFDLINCLDGSNYIVPAAGYYHPNGLGTNGFDWSPNNFSGTWIPASSSQMLGGAYAIWHDSIDTRANGIDEQDTFEYFFDPLPYYACSLWGHNGMSLAEVKDSVSTLAYAPQTNPTNEVELANGTAQYFRYNFTDAGDRSGNGRDLALQNATVQGGVLSLSGGASYAEIGLDRLAWDSKLSFKVKKLAGGGSEQIIFEGDHAYGEFAIKAVPVEGDDTKWKLGFSRELYDFVYEDAELPVGEWVTLTLINAKRSTLLYVDDGDTGYVPTGYFRSNADSNTQFKGVSYLSGTKVHGGIDGGSSFSIPVVRIGSMTSAFKGLVDDVCASPSGASSSSVADNTYDIPVDQYAGATAGTAQSGSGANNAIDGNPSSVWHTTWNTTCQPADRWFMIELNAVTQVGGLSYLGTGGSNGAIREFHIETSEDGNTWTTVVENGTFANKAEWQNVRFEAVDAKYVRLWADKTDGAQDSTLGTGQFISASEIRVCRPISLITDGTGTVTLDETSYPLVDGKAEPEPLVIFGNTVLTKGTDYTVSYANNTAAGTATVTVTGAGGYVGTLTANFEVTAPVAKTDLSTATVTFAQTSYPLENGKAEPEPIVKVGNTTLLRGLDYDVTYENNSAAGTATATITGIGDYTGEKNATFTVTEAIVKKNLSDTAKTKVVLPQTTFPYDGVAIKPEPVVTYDGETLVKGTHYTVSYARNNAVGTATVTVVGRAPYCEGSASATFTIVDPAKGNDLSDVTKTVVTLKPTQYEYTGKPITPTFTVRYNGVRLTQGTDYTVELSQNVNGGTGVLVIHGAGDYYGSFVATFTIVGGGTGTGDNTGNTGNNSGSSSSGSNIPSVGVTTTEITKGDGVTTTIKTDSFGAMLAQSTYDDGTKVIADIPVTGPVTAVVTVPARVDTVTVTIPTRGEPTPGQVAVILHPDGTEEIVKTSLPTEDGVELTLDASATVQIVDNAKPFTDVPANSWAKDAIDFVTSREIFNGTGNSTFSPSGDMSRAMVCTVLANLAGEDTKGGATWYEKAVDWAQQSGISDGTVPNAIVTREQLAAMLYRYAGSPAVLNEVPRRFRDRDSVSDWAELAVTWAVENDLIRGRSSLEGLDLAPHATASRAEVAAVFQRYVALLK